MIIVVVDECLEVPYFDLLLPVFALHQRVQLEFLCVVLGSVRLHQLLDYLVALKVSRGQAEDVIGLLLSDKPALDSESFFSDLLSAFVAELFHVALLPLPLKVLHDLLHPLVHGERPYLAFEAVGSGCALTGFLICLFPY